MYWLFPIEFTCSSWTGPNVELNGLRAFTAANARQIGVLNTVPTGAQFVLLLLFTLLTLIQHTAVVVVQFAAVSELEM
jgi:hypothetical protein